MNESAHSGYARVALEGIDGLVNILDDGGVFNAGDVTGRDGVEGGSSLVCHSAGFIALLLLLLLLLFYEGILVAYPEYSSDVGLVCGEDLKYMLAHVKSPLCSPNTVHYPIYPLQYDTNYYYFYSSKNCTRRRSSQSAQVM